MGVAGLWDILRPAGQLRSLTELAVVEGFEKNKNGKRGYRVGIDASIWFVHAAWGKEGENPELRTLFFRLCRLAEAPFLPLLVFDGPHRPSWKRGIKINPKHRHSLQSGFKRMVSAFGYEWHEAPGEAEAELAYLNQIGKIDAILSDDVDNFIFGARVVIRNKNNTLSGNKSNPNKNADGRDDGNHTVVYRADLIKNHPEVSLTRNGLILIGLMSGGDYDGEGLKKCGPKISRALAMCGFGDALVEGIQSTPQSLIPAFLAQWRRDVAQELRTNSRKIVGKKYAVLASEIEALADFPPLHVIDSYINPITTGKRGKAVDDSQWWSKDISLTEVASCCEQFFEWGIKDIIVKRFRTVLWPGACIRVLRQATREQDARTRRLGDNANPITSTPQKQKRPPAHLALGTPSKLITKYLSRLDIESPSRAGRRTGEDEDTEDQLMIKIHSTRQHASTDHILEYRVEIDPSHFVKLAESGVIGTRRIEDLQGPDTYTDLEASGDENAGDGKKPKKVPPKPSDPLRVWLPASMVEMVQPALIEEWEAKEEAKKAKKAGKGKGRKKKADTDEENEVVEPKKPKASKAKTREKTKKLAKAWESSEEEEEEDENVREGAVVHDDDEDSPVPVPKRPTNTTVDQKATRLSKEKKALMIFASEDEEPDEPLPRTAKLPKAVFAPKDVNIVVAPRVFIDEEDEEEPLHRPVLQNTANSDPLPVTKHSAKPRSPTLTRPSTSQGFTFSIPNPDDSEIEEPSPPRPRQSSTASKAPERKPIKYPSAVDFFDQIFLDKPSTTAKPVKPTKAALKSPQPKPKQKTKTSNAVAGPSKPTGVLAKAQTSQPERPKTSRVKKTRTSSVFSSSSELERSSLPKSPRKSSSQSSPHKVVPHAQPKSKKAAEYIDISSSSDEDVLPALLFRKPVPPPPRSRSTSTQPSLTKKSAPKASTSSKPLDSFGFREIKLAGVQSKISKSVTRKLPTLLDYDIIDLT